MAGTPNKPNYNETLESLETLSDEELVALKSQAIANEDYDKAKEIKSEQDRRKKIKNTKLESVDKKSDLKRVFENNEYTQKTIEISDEELENSIDLVKKIQYINHFYEGAECYDEDIKQLKSFDTIQREKYFKDHEISSKLDFQNYVLKLCDKYLNDLCEFKKTQIALDLDDIIAAQESLNNYQEYLDFSSNSEISDLLNPISNFLESLRQAVSDYVNQKLIF